MKERKGYSSPGNPCGRPRSKHVFLRPEELPPPTYNGIPYMRIKYVTDPGREPEPLTDDEVRALESFGPKPAWVSVAERLCLDGSGDGNAFVYRKQFLDDQKKAVNLKVDLGVDPTYWAWCDCGPYTDVYVLNLMTREWELERRINNE